VDGVEGVGNGKTWSLMVKRWGSEVSGTRVMSRISEELSGVYSGGRGGESWVGRRARSHSACNFLNTWSMGLLSFAPFAFSWVVFWMSFCAAPSS